MYEDTDIQPGMLVQIRCGGCRFGQEGCSGQDELDGEVVEVIMADDPRTGATQEEVLDEWEPEAETALLYIVDGEKRLGIPMSCWCCSACALTLIDRPEATPVVAMEDRPDYLPLLGTCFNYYGSYDWQ